MLLVGAALRVHALGHDALWYDEAGQISAAIQPTWVAMALAIRNHVRALPLDYVVTRAAVALAPGLAPGSTEFFLRVPALLWGVLALAALWALARRVADQRTALLAMVLLSLWAQHVRYSQELRFYAALTFFALFTTAALLAAIRRPTLARWLLAGASALIGSYFHPYVLLAFVAGGTGLTAAPPAGAGQRRAWVGLVVTALVVGLLFAPGYWHFGGQQQFDYDLLEFGGSLASVTASGLGLLAVNYSSRTPLFGLWEAVQLSGTLLGAAAVLLAPRRHRALVALAAAAGLQVGLILIADVVKGYWFLVRQLLATAPLLMVLAAFGYMAAADRLARALRWPALRRLLPAGVALALAVGAAPNLAWYYAYPRTTADVIAALVAERHQPGEPVYILSSYEAELYRFHLRRLAAGAAVLPDLQPLTWEALPMLPARPGATYLVVSERPTEEQVALVTLLGFQPLLVWDGNWQGAESLYVRGP